MTVLLDSDSLQNSHERLEDGAVLLRGFAAAEGPLLLEEVTQIAQCAAFRHLVTPGGYTMSVAMTNCGRVGWGIRPNRLSLRPRGSPDSSSRPPMPPAFLDIAARAAAEAGFKQYDPDACLINHDVAGAKLSLHQDRDEKDAWAPIVSVSLGLPALFLWGGKRRSDPVYAGCASKAVTLQWAVPHHLSITVSLRSGRGGIR